MTELRKFAPNTLGHAYAEWLDAQGVTPDTRRPVHFVDDAQLAYVMQRYRETHDFVHVLTGASISVADEVAVKWFEWEQTGLPMTLLSGIGGQVSLTQSERSELFHRSVPRMRRLGQRGKFYLNVYYERRLEQDVDELKRELNLHG